MRRNIATHPGALGQRPTTSDVQRPAALGPNFLQKRHRALRASSVWDQPVAPRPDEIAFTLSMRRSSMPANSSAEAP
jgi:hypothetical protein